MYADYAFYSEVYLGAVIREADFKRLCTRASDYIDYLTQHRAPDAAGQVREAVKKAVCAVAEIIYTQERIMQDEGGTPLPGLVSSETVGGHSVSYGAPPADQTDRYLAASHYLAHTGLLYGGAAVR